MPATRASRTRPVSVDTSFATTRTSAGPPTRIVVWAANGSLRRHRTPTRRAISAAATAGSDARPGVGPNHRNIAAAPTARIAVFTRI